MEHNLNKKQAIQGTSSDALMQKLFAISKGYYQDIYQHKLAGTNISDQKFLPIMNRGTWSRVKAIRSQIEFIIEQNLKNSNKTQIINLGCGMDSLFFYLKNKYVNYNNNNNNNESSELKNICVLELDYSEITKQKIKNINYSKDLKKMLLNSNDDNNNKGSISSDNKKITFSKEYNLINCDLNNSKELVDIINYTLDNGFFSSNNLTIIVAECLLCYLNKEEALNMIKNISNKIDNCVIIYYDVINPNDEFGKVMINNLKQFRNITLPGYTTYPDEISHENRMKECGFTYNNKCIDMLKYFNNYIPENEKNLINHLELLDELEEWNLLQQHYCIGFGIKISNEDNYEFLKCFNLV